MKYFLAVLPSIVLIILGISIKYYKAYWLISGYNTMSAEKKKNVDVESLGRVMGNFCFVLAGLIFAFTLTSFFELTAFTIIISVVLVVTIISFIIKAQKFDGNALKSDGTMKTSTKIMIAFLILVFLGVGILLYQSTKPARYTITEQKMEISGLYGETIDFEDIIELSINDTMPRITMRTNGSAVGSRLKGYFNVEGIGRTKLFVNTKIRSFIVIKTAKRTIILNSEDEAKTQEIFKELEKMIK